MLKNVKMPIFLHFKIYEHAEFHVPLSWAWTNFITSGPGLLMNLFHSSLWNISQDFSELPNTVCGFSKRGGGAIHPGGTLILSWYFGLDPGPKMHTKPKTSPVLWWSQKISTNSSYPKNNSFFWKHSKNWNSRFESPKMVWAYVYTNISEYPTTPLGLFTYINGYANVAYIPAYF